MALQASFSFSSGSSGVGGHSRNLPAWADRAEEGRQQAGFQGPLSAAAATDTVKQASASFPPSLPLYLHSE